MPTFWNATTAGNRAGLHKWSRFIDYAVVFSSLYPLASYRFIHDEFTIGSTLLLYPEMLKTPLVFYAVSAFFVVALTAFVVKTVIEIRQGRVHYPKILLMAMTVGLSILITSYRGDRLEIAFQGFNTWHSFQYLGADVVHHHPAAATRRDRTGSAAGHRRQGTVRGVLRR